MPKLSKRLLWVFAVTTVAGACLHFLYALAPNPITALFSPVNESLWEHVKILFWPYLVAALVVTRGGGKGCRTPWLLTLPILCGLMLGVGYVYHILLDGEALAVDMGLYVLLMTLGFLLPGGLHRTADAGGLRDLAALLVLVIAAAVVVFTFLPPDHVLFTDLSGVNTWSTIPYC